MFDLLDSLIQDGLHLTVELWKQPAGPVHLTITDHERAGALPAYTLTGDWDDVQARAPEKVRQFLEAKQAVQGLLAELRQQLDASSTVAEPEPAAVLAPIVVEASPPAGPKPISASSAMGESPLAASLLAALEQKPKPPAAPKVRASRPRKKVEASTVPVIEPAPVVTSPERAEEPAPESVVSAPEPEWDDLFEEAPTPRPATPPTPTLGSVREFLAGLDPHSVPF